MCCLTVGHAPDCPCWRCDSRRFFYEPPPESARILVDANRAAAHLAKLGLSLREAARLSGLSASTLHKAAKAGARIDQQTEERILALGRRPR
jgi:hypothetical protein